MINGSRMLTLADKLEADALALRRAAALLNGHAIDAKRATFPAVVAAAVKLRKRGRYKKRRHSGGVSIAAKEKRRQTDTILKAIAEAGPLLPTEIADRFHVSRGWLGPMSSRGYLKRGKGGKYRRTAKAFTIELYKSKRGEATT